MSRLLDSMKLKINKACDLNSISVLPPHSRRSNPMSQASQMRSQSQQSLSQGMSLSQSQLSQNSFDDTLMNEQRFGSQERDNSSKRMTSLAAGMATRDESQMQLASTSNNVMRRWSSASIPDNRCQVSGELENKLRQMESSLNRLNMIMDSVQSDVMQVNRAVKEVSLEAEGVRQKIILLDNSMQQVIKEEEGIKAFLDVNLKSLPEKIVESDRSKLNEIASAISAIPKQIDAHLAKFQHEVCMVVTKKIEVIVNGMKSLNNCYSEPSCSPQINCYIAAGPPQQSHMPISVLPPSGHTRRVPGSRNDTETPRTLQPKLTGQKIAVDIPKTLQPKLTGQKIAVDIPKTLQPKITGSNRSMTVKQEETPFISKRNHKVIIDSDEDSDDGGLSCILLKKETGKKNCLIEEAREETLRILRKARKRKRKQDNCVILD